MNQQQNNISGFPFYKQVIMYMYTRFHQKERRLGLYFFQSMFGPANAGICWTFYLADVSSNLRLFEFAKS